MNTLECQLLVFKEVVETKNITLASKRLHISQPSVSIQIKGLEQEYGAKLFDRTNKGVTLTKAGEILYEYGCRAVAVMQEARELIDELAFDQHRSVRLGATLTIGEYILPHIIGYLDSLFDSLDFHVKIANTEIIAQDVLENRLHIALVEGPIQQSQAISIETFCHDELALVVPMSHPWARRESVTFGELTKERMITREKGSGTRKVMELALSRGGFDPARLNIIADLGSTEAIKHAVIEGLGVTIISILTVQQECRLGLLKTLQIEGCQLARPLNIITHNKGFKTEEELLFLDFLRDTQRLESILPFSQAQAAQVVQALRDNDENGSLPAETHP
ncbi:MAG: LysR family transcriptional regulator [Coriobacteriia bacterium]|nr:LysR family transcriptional regulator [Coriobacteriia bacterium]